MYERIVRELAPALTEAEARGVVGSMRLQYATLDHLPRSTFAREIRTALACESAEPGYLAACAEGV